jgi:hypothetical protein
MAALESQLAQQREQLDAMRSQLEQLKAAKPVAPGPALSAPDAVDPAADPALAALIADAGKESVTAPEEQEAQLRVYGFADVGLQRIWTDKELAVLEGQTNELTFVLGNVNLYFDAHPWKDWRFLTELRFGLFPDDGVPRPAGSVSFDPAIRTTISDPTGSSGGFTILKWAGVYPQRAHIDWTPSDLFNLRVGLFLTPYGIWNVDHGTPTRIMASEPLISAAQLVPNQLLGVETFGTTPALPWTVGYHLHVSNGRTVGQVDLTDNKALGGRVFASTRDPFPIKLGVSGYWGSSEDAEHTVTGSRSTKFAFTEYSVAGDLSLDIGALRIRSELVVNWTIYKDGERQELLGLKMADTMRLGTYIVFAYRLPWLGLEPLAMLEWLRYPIPRALPVGEGVLMGSVGLNAYFTPATMLRTQFGLAHGVDLSANPVDAKGLLYQCVARLITSF